MTVSLRTNVTRRMQSLVALAAALLVGYATASPSSGDWLKLRTAHFDI